MLDSNNDKLSIKMSHKNITFVASGIGLLVGCVIYSVNKTTSKKQKQYELEEIEIKKEYDLMAMEEDNKIFIKFLENQNYCIPMEFIWQKICSGFDITLIPDRYINDKFWNYIWCLSYPEGINFYKLLHKHTKTPSKFLSFEYRKQALIYGMRINELNLEHRTSEIYDFAIQNGYIKFDDIPEEYKTERFYVFCISEHCIEFADIPEKYRTENHYINAVNNNSIQFVDIPEKYKTENNYLYALKTSKIKFNDIPEDKRNFAIYSFGLANKYIKFNAIPEDKKDLEMYKFAFVNLYIDNYDLVPEKYLTMGLYSMASSRVINFAPEKYLTQDMCLHALATCTPLNCIPDKFQNDILHAYAIAINIANFQFIKNPSDEICRLAIGISQYSVMYIEPQKLSYEICKHHLMLHHTLTNIPNKAITKELLLFYLDNYETLATYSQHPFQNKELSEQNIDDIIDFKDKTYKINTELFVGCVLTGLQFNKICGDMKFVKLTNETEKHNRLQFSDGLIVDILPFSPKGACSPGGIYFCDSQNIARWRKYGDCVMHYIRPVVILDDAKIYIEEGKFKADKIFLGPRELIT
jgi:YHS domain-containing protein